MGARLGQRQQEGSDRPVSGERRVTADENKAGLSGEWQGASGWGEVGGRQRRMRSERCVGAGRVCPVGHWETSDFIQ